jgi:putative sigma-54 modulation protein
MKRFDMLPMFEEDAIAQMEELGHAFFVYLSAETDEIAVIYRRNDGNYGLIEPVVKRGGRTGRR